MTDIGSPAPVPMTAGEKATRKGAALGLFAGWLIGLIYIIVWVPRPLFDPKIVSFTDEVLMAAPLAGAVVGAALGWMLRGSDRFAKLARLLTLRTGLGVNWRSRGWKIGAAVGLLLASQYMRSHSSHGFYPGSIFLVYELFVPICAFIGAGIGWYMMQTRAVPSDTDG